MIELKIDDKTIQAQEGETVLQAALRNGIDIPHFCYHPCLSVVGNCRICLVQVDGRPKLMPSCNLAAAPGMTVETASDAVREAREAVMQFITLNHPGECGLCDKAGECRVQDYQEKYGAGESLSVDPKDRKAKFTPLNERIVLDAERCILCSRCVRFTQEVSGSHQLGIVGRGGHARVERLQSRPFDDPYSDNVVTLCPTGALLSRESLYTTRAWYLEPVSSVCPGCARACSIAVWRRKKEWHVRSLDKSLNTRVYRVTPRENPEINGPWICNQGYDLQTFVSRPRALTPLVAGRAATVAEAFAEGRRLLAAAKNPAAIVSAQGSNEELEAFRASLGGRLTVYTREDGGDAAKGAPQDDFLIRDDKNPNTFRVRALFGSRPYEPAAGHDLVVLWGDGFDYGAFGAAAIVHLASFAPPPERAADLLLPVSLFLERTGSFCNFEGTMNRFEKVFDKPELVQHASEVFGRLG